RRDAPRQQAPSRRQQQQEGGRRRRRDERGHVRGGEGLHRRFPAALWARRRWTWWFPRTRRPRRRRAGSSTRARLSRWRWPPTRTIPGGPPVKRGRTVSARAPAPQPAQPAPAQQQAEQPARRGRGRPRKQQQQLPASPPPQKKRKQELPQRLRRPRRHRHRQDVRAPQRARRKAAPRSRRHPTTRDETLRPRAGLAQNQRRHRLEPRLHVQQDGTAGEHSRRRHPPGHPAGTHGGHQPRVGGPDRRPPQPRPTGLRSPVGVGQVHGEADAGAVHAQPERRLQAHEHEEGQHQQHAPVRQQLEGPLERDARRLRLLPQSSLRPGRRPQQQEGGQSGRGQAQHGGEIVQPG
ncbi:unnamed protein product, partial [Sphagnum tenellum]